MTTPKLDYSALPEHLRAGMRRYFEGRIRPGHFLSAVLEGNLRYTALYADEDSLLALPVIVRWLVNEAPCGTWGTPDCVRAWLAHRHPSSAVLRSVS